MLTLPTGNGRGILPVGPDDEGRLTSVLQCDGPGGFQRLRRLAARPEATEVEVRDPIATSYAMIY